MTVDAVAGALFERVASRERDAQRAFMPGALAENGDVAAAGEDARPVSDPLSAGIPAEAYVVVGGEGGRTLYTRDGGFHLQDGTLRDAGGRPVQGYNRPRSPLGAVRVNPVDLELGRVADARIEPDGRLTYLRTVVDPRSGERQQQRVSAGRIALARFAAGTSLQPMDATHAAAAADVVPHLGMPGDGRFASLRPAHLSRSHIDLDASLVKLKESYLAFDALRAARQVHASVQKTATDLIK